MWVQWRNESKASVVCRSIIPGDGKSGWKAALSVVANNYSHLLLHDTIPIQNFSIYSGYSLLIISVSSRDLAEEDVYLFIELVCQLWCRHSIVYSFQLEFSGKDEFLSDADDEGDCRFSLTDKRYVTGNQ